MNSDHLTCWKVHWPADTSCQPPPNTFLSFITHTARNIINIIHSDGNTKYIQPYSPTHHSRFWEWSLFYESFAFWEYKMHMPLCILTNVNIHLFGVKYLKLQILKLQVFSSSELTLSWIINAFYELIYYMLEFWSCLHPTAIKLP